MMQNKEKPFTAQKMKCSIKDLFNKCDQIHRKLRIWSHLLKKFLMENLILFANENFSNSAEDAMASVRFVQASI